MITITTNTLIVLLDLHKYNKPWNCITHYITFFVTGQALKAGENVWSVGMAIYSEEKPDDTPEVCMMK